MNIKRHGRSILETQPIVLYGQQPGPLVKAPCASLPLALLLYYEVHANYLALLRHDREPVQSTRGDRRGTF